MSIGMFTIFEPLEKAISKRLVKFFEKQKKNVKNELE
jgi:hypothetical protein